MTFPSPRCSVLVSLACLAFCSAGLTPPVLAEDAADDVTPLRAWDSLLEDAGIDPADLSRGAPPDWLGHADAASVPFLLPHYPWVRDDPRHLLRLGENLLALADGQARRDEGPELSALLTGFALQPRLAGFRGFPRPQAQTPTPTLAELLERTGAEAERARDLPEALHAPLADLLAALLDAVHGVESSWRHVAGVTLERALATADVPRLLPGAGVPWPDLEDAARLGHDVDRAAAALRLASALDALRSGDPIPAGIDLEEPWTVDTRFGAIRVGGRGEDLHPHSWLVLDLGGDDTYLNAGMARMPTLPAALAVDLGGSDHYRGAQAWGLGGVGVVADFAGDDDYQAFGPGQGFGLLGYGILFDAQGNDRYVALGGAQGAGVFGAGLLVDVAGDDRFEIHGEGQGFGGPGAAGALVDLEGHDRYVAEPNPQKAPGRSDYHSEGLVNASNAQGAGVGRRGELTDGHVWAGGVGVLVDLRGNDEYEAGNFAQASGYAYGTGLLLDGGGDDRYRSTYFAQGSALHEAFALLLDRAGNDHHVLDDRGGPVAGAGLGYGWDLAVGLLVDQGGNDVYQAQRLALGAADRSSLGVLLELAGNDTYRTPDGEPGVRLLGATAGDPRNGEPGRPPHRAASGVTDLGLFLDLGGDDVYPLVRRCEPADGRSWSCGASDADGRVVGFGVDRGGGSPEP